MHTLYVSSTNELLQKELKYLLKVLHETNSFPHYIIKQILKQVQDEQNQQNVNVPTSDIADETNANRKKNICYLYNIMVKKETMSLGPWRKEWNVYFEQIL